MTRIYTFLSAIFFLSMLSMNAQAWNGRCQSDYDCGSNQYCVHVPGDNNNYCEYSSGNGGSCQSDYDCGYNQECVHVPGNNNNYCTWSSSGSEHCQNDRDCRGNQTCDMFQETITTIANKGVNTELLAAQGRE